MPILLFIILSTLCFQTNAAPVTPISLENNYNFVHEVDYLLDPHHSETIDSVKKNNSWKPVNKNNINFSFIKDSLWLRFSVKAVENGDWILKIPVPLLDNIDVFGTLNYKSLSPISTGDTKPFSSRVIEHPYFLFPYSLKKNDQLDIYLRVQTSGASEVPINFMPKHISDNENDIQTFLQGWMNGILVVMIFYNLVIYILAKDRLYLSYSVMVISYLLLYAAYNGTGFQYIWPNHPEWNSPIFAFINGFYQLTNAIFIIMFLNLLQRKTWYMHYFKILLYIFLILFPLTVIAPYQIIIPIYIILSIILNISGLLIGIYLSLKGEKIALYFTIAWSLLIFGIMIGNLRGFGLVPVNFITLYSYQLAVFIEVTILSIALANRIKTEQEENILNLKHFQDLYNTALSGQFSLNNKGILQSVNPAFGRMLGYDNEEEMFMLSKKWNGRYFHVDKDLPDRMRGMLEKVGQAFDLELQLRTKKGDAKWFSVSIQTVRNKKGNVIAYEGSMIDINERKENEHLKKRSIQERMIAMEHLVVGICHEINTPLGISTTAINQLKEDLILLNEVFISGKLTKSDFTERLEIEDETAKLIEKNLSKINDLIKSFKDISVLQKGYRYETGSVYELLDQHITKYYQFIDPKNIHINCQKPLDFIGYTNALDDVLEQIIMNSIHHSGKNSNDLEIFITASVANNTIIIKVGNNGTQISTNNIRDIFNPFYTTTKGANASIGLGLYQAFNIVTQLLTGNIEVENKEPGVEFTITFPLHVKERRLHQEPTLVSE